MNIAMQIVTKCGGAKTVAKILKINVSCVYRWTYSRERGGTDGKIPTRHQAVLLSKARLLGIDLTPADFFPPNEPAQ